ncbi:hypothetical protein APED_14655 [Acanthopleuribacter pedis]
MFLRIFFNLGDQIERSQATEADATHRRAHQLKRTQNTLVSFPPAADTPPPRRRNPRPESSIPNKNNTVLLTQPNQPSKARLQPTQKDGSTSIPSARATRTELFARISHKEFCCEAENHAITRGRPSALLGRAAFGVALLRRMVGPLCRLSIVIFVLTRLSAPRDESL